MQRKILNLPSNTKKQYMNFKRYIAFTLLVVISFKMLVVPFIYLDFELRKDYIIQNLCENRFKPELHCDGKCYLAKTLNKIAEDNAKSETEKQSQHLKKIISETFDEQLIVLNSFEVVLTLDKPQFYNQPCATADYVNTILHPPYIVTGI